MKYRNQSLQTGNESVIWNDYCYCFFDDQTQIPQYLENEFSNKSYYDYCLLHTVRLGTRTEQVMLITVYSGQRIYDIISSKRLILQIIFTFDSHNLLIQFVK